MTSLSGQWYFRAPHAATAFVFDSSVPSKAASETIMPPGHNSSEEEDNNASRRYRYVEEVVNSGGGIMQVFRHIPDEPLLVPFIESSFVRACLQIRSLENATLATNLREIIELNGKSYNFGSEWGIYFAALAIQSSWYPVPQLPGYPEEDLTVLRLTFNTRNWRLDVYLYKLLRGIGGYRLNLEEKHLDLWEMVEKLEEMERIKRRLSQSVT